MPLALFALLAIQAIQGRRHAKNRAPAGLNPVMRTICIVAAVGVLGLVAMVSFGHSRIATSLERFDSAGDGKRAEMREDALSSARHYWPVGAGMGTFDTVFQVDESLEYLSPRRAGRAHMDYYELAIEAGIAGLILVACWFIWILTATWQALQKLNWMALAGAGFMACCAAQSMLSFPLRNQAMLAMAALAVLLVRLGLRDKKGRA
ncbi:O-antigen ligase family protein [Novosphingobium sp. PC22D]|uniref:O-antigen ligase family protein n=1 Tax=Novosphingobium sp. PC22D TaxID=1962403 RepID=UPI0014389901|nr:O-antigen ligase family protein [Novosphingobium sp. PC22D]